MRLSNYPFFNQLPPLMLSNIEKGLNEVSFAKGAIVVAQGEPNTKIFVLVRGELEVRVDGELVASITHPGDFIGEMSVIDQSLTSASVVSRELSTCLSIEAADLGQALNNTEHQAQFFKLYARLLSSRLLKTNQKAKQVERTLRELEIAQASLEKFNAKLQLKVVQTQAEVDVREAAIDLSWLQFEEMVKDRSLALDGMRSFYHKDLPYLLDNLKKEPELGSLRDRLYTLQTTLDPLIASLDEDLALTNKRVLIVQKNKKNLMMSKMALGGLGVQVDAFSQITDLGPLDSYDLVISDQENLTALSQMGGWSSLLYVADHDRDRLIEVIHAVKPGVHFSSIPVGARAFVIKAWQGIVRNLLSRRENRMQHYLSRGATVYNAEVVSSETRQAAIDEAIDHFSSYGIRPNLLSRVQAVSEEFLMNAIYDAPTDADGKAKYNHLTRQQNVELEVKERPKFQFATDGSTLSIAVSDPFGGLRLKDVKGHLESCYKQNPDLADRANKGGAGRGLHQIVENADFVVISVIQGVSTQFFALFHLDAVTEDHGPKIQLNFR